MGKINWRGKQTDKFRGRFDHQLIFNEIYQLGGLLPKLVRQGNKLFEMEVSKKGVITKTIFRDT